MGRVPQDGLVVVGEVGAAACVVFSSWTAPRKSAHACLVIAGGELRSGMGVDTKGGVSRIGSTRLRAASWAK